MIKETFVFDGLPASRSASLYATHLGYGHAVSTLIGVLRAANHGVAPPAFGSSVHELTNRLQGMVHHALRRAECEECGHVMSADEKVLYDLVAEYARTDHAAKADGYTNIKIALRPVAGGDQQGIPLLFVWHELVEPVPQEEPSTRRDQRRLRRQAEGMTA
jgi:hypothetical protein